VDESFPFTDEGIVRVFEKTASKKSVGKNILKIIN
jgi:hypothetical protein